MLRCNALSGLDMVLECPNTRGFAPGYLCASALRYFDPERLQPHRQSYHTILREKIKPIAARWDANSPYFRNMGIVASQQPDICPVGTIDKPVCEGEIMIAMNFIPSSPGREIFWYVHPFPQMNLWAICMPSLAGRFIPPLFPRKRGGQGVILGH